MVRTRVSFSVMSPRRGVPVGICGALASREEVARRAGRKGTFLERNDMVVWKKGTEVNHSRHSEAQRLYSTQRRFLRFRGSRLSAAVSEVLPLGKSKLQSTCHWQPNLRCLHSVLPAPPPDVSRVLTPWVVVGMQRHPTKLNFPSFSHTRCVLLTPLPR